MWSVDQAKLDGDGRLYYSFTKIGVYPQNAPEEVQIDVLNRMLCPFFFFVVVV